MRLRVDRLCAIACLAVLGCGRIGYSTVALVSPDSGPGDALADLPPDATVDRANGPLDLAPDVAPDLAPDLAPDTAPDLAPDAGPSGPPRLLNSSVVSGASPASSWLHDAGQGAGRYLLVGATTRTTAPRVLSVSYAGRPLTLLAEHRAGGCGVTVFGLEAPAAGTNIVRIDLDGMDDTIVFTASFVGRVPSLTQQGRYTVAGTTSPAQLITPAVPGQLVVNTACLHHTAPLLTPGPGQTALHVQQMGQLGAAVATRPAQPTTQMAWTFSGGPATGWALITVFLSPASGP